MADDDRAEVPVPPGGSCSRVADQGAQNRRLPGLQLRRRVLPRPHPRPAALTPPTSWPSTTEPWARSVNVDDNFEPLYTSSAPDKKATVRC